jgi:hypothetical protein
LRTASAMATGIRPSMLVIASGRHTFLRFRIERGLGRKDLADLRGFKVAGWEMMEDGYCGTSGDKGFKQELFMEVCKE